MLRNTVLLVGGLASLCVNSLFAQDTILGQKYGLGAHAYFAGDYRKAHDQLAAAIDGGSQDPRVFYFRGLTYLKLGRTPEAIMDFQKGAELETRDVNKFYNVAKSLERVQGLARVELENYRVEARMAALEEAEKVRKARYEAIRREESRVLREQIVTPAPEPAKSAAPSGAQPIADTDVFTLPDEKPTAGAEKKPAEAAEPAAKPAETSAAVESVEKKPAEAPAPVHSDDPFAVKPAEKPEAAKPAEEKKTPTPPPAKKPAAKPEGEDPFAAPKPEAAEEKKPATEEKPAEEKAAKAKKFDPSDPFAS